MTDGPLKQAFDLLDTDGVLSRELITYRIKDGMVIKQVASRRYSNNDYTDYNKTEPLTKIEK
jgi:hypothetical protein